LLSKCFGRKNKWDIETRIFNLQMQKHSRSETNGERKYLYLQQQKTPSEPEDENPGDNA